MFIKINAENFKTEISEEKCPLLLAYICRDHNYLNQAKALESVAKIFAGSLKVCLLDQTFNGVLQHYRIEGSPTFIIFYDGEEKGRILGQIDKESLIALALKISPYLNGKNDQMPVAWWSELK